MEIPEVVRAKALTARLLLTQISFQPVGRQMLAAADRIARDCPA